MAFVLQDHPRRFCDPERKLELRVRATDRDGYVHFVISGPGWDCDVTAKPEFEAHLGSPAGQKKLIWHVAGFRSSVPHLPAEQAKAAIKEALEAFKYTFGKPTEQLTGVRFDGRL